MTGVLDFFTFCVKIQLIFLANVLEVTKFTKHNMYKRIVDKSVDAKLQTISTGSTL